MISSILTGEAHARARSLAAAMLSAALAGCGFGLLMPLIALNLDAMTGSGAVVGANAAASAISTLIATLFIPTLLSRFPARVAIFAAASLVALSFLLFPLMRDVTVWFVVRFLMGLAVTVIFVSSETWINQLARPAARASLLAVYASVLSLGFGIGGLLLAVLGAQGWAPWIAGAIIFILGGLPVLLLRGPELDPPKPADAGIMAIVRIAALAPVAILAGFTFGALETSIFSLFPVYLERLGLSIQLIGLLVLVGALGGIALQYPIGRFADRAGRVRALFLIATASLALPLLILVSGARAGVLFPLAFFYVGFAGAFYTVGLAMIGERLGAGSLAAGNAAFIFAYGLGSLAGPLLAGAAMDGYDPYGLMLTFAAIAALYLVIMTVVFSRRRH